MHPVEAGFVAINEIHCEPSYVERFKDLFLTRAHAIDRRNGFAGMTVLEPRAEDGPYLVMSYWKDEASFQEWTNSPEFIEGHRRGFEDLRKAKERGEAPPMRSNFSTYAVLCH